MNTMSGVRDNDLATPMMQQYLSIKNQYQDAILFFRLGDFYEMFLADAEVAARELDITLTSRSKGAEPVPMCGVPYHTASTYIHRLVAKGHKVAVCDQVEDPKLAKGIVRREVVQVVTPGLVIEQDGLTASESNYLAAVVEDDERYGFSYIDISTGEFCYCVLPSLESVTGELARVRPRELLVNGGEGLKALAAQHAKRENCLFNELSRHETSPVKPVRVTVDGAEIDPVARLAAATIEQYLEKNGIRPAGHYAMARSYEPSSYLVMDESARRHLELFESFHERTRKGTLTEILDRTATAMGARYLRKQLLFPLMDIHEINERLDIVGGLMKEVIKRQTLKSVLSEIYDIERLNGRIAVGRVSPRDLAALGRSLKLIPKLRLELASAGSSAVSGLAERFLPLDLLTELLDRALVDTPPISSRDGGFIREGFDAEVDRLRALSRNAKETLAALEQAERKRTGINSLKVRYNRVFGYFIEITKANLGNVPAHYIRKQTLVNAERFITDELKKFEETILSAQTKLIELEQDHFESLIGTAAQYVVKISSLATEVARADLFVTLAEVADEMNYSRPTLVDDPVLIIRDGRHPVVERYLMNERFVPNDLDLGRDFDMAILTGPNMAGKSTLLRQSALIVLMAQIGSFVPAAEATIGIADRIFTRVGASDHLARGESTFMVEMRESAQILRHATRRSLLVLDEIGRGTSTFDGLSIAWSIADYILNQIQARSLFATHYHELTELGETHARAANFSMAVREYQDQVIFLRRLVRGGANKSYGIQVAKMAGLPQAVISRAQEILQRLEFSGASLSVEGEPKQLSLALLSPSADTADPAVSAVLSQLDKLDLDELSPRMAFALLASLQQQIHASRADKTGR